MQMGYEPGADEARALHWFVHKVNVFMHTVAFACLIVSVSFWSPKINETGIIRSAARTRAIATQTRAGFIKCEAASYTEKSQASPDQK
jgi:hypothetical protein